MPRDSSDYLLRRWLWALPCAAALSMCGCEAWKNWMGDGFHDEMAPVAANLRPAGPKGDLYFFDSQGQQIEKDLGVR